MRLTRHLVLVVLTIVAAAAACGPSAVQLRAARDARYQGSREEVLGKARAAVAPSYAVEAMDEAAGTIVTAPRWYEPDGGNLGTGDTDREGGMAVRTEAGSVSLAFRIRVAGDAPPYRVLVEPIAKQKRSNYSALYEYAVDDPALPGWVTGKVDNLQLEIHDRLERSVAVAPPSDVATN